MHTDRHALSEILTHGPSVGESEDRGATVIGPPLFDNDNDKNKPIKSLLKGKSLLPPVGLARLDS
jgi:hypothetical protein